MTVSGSLYLLVGPVGAGKTTFARRRAVEARAVFLDLDSCMVRLFGGDERPADALSWYLERRERCRELLWDQAQAVLRCGVDVFLELGLVGRQERETFYGRAQGEDVRLRVLLLDAPKEVRRQRVEKRNASTEPFIQVVPPEFFERASAAWESPSEEERRTWDIVDV